MRIRRWLGLTYVMILAACVPASVETAPRDPDPTYSATAEVARYFDGNAECTPAIATTTRVITLLAEPGSCPTAFYDDTPTPCMQVEDSAGQRYPLPHGLVGLGAAGSPERRVRVAGLIYPDTATCRPHHAADPDLIYIGPA